MARKTAYEKLELRIKELEKKILEGKRNEEALRHEARRAEGLRQICEVINSDLDLDTLLQTVIDQARSLIGADYAEMHFGEVHTRIRDGRFSKVFYSGFNPAACTVNIKPSLKGLNGEIFRIKKPLCLDDRTRHPHSVPLPEGHPEMGPFLGVPVIIDGKCTADILLTRLPGCRFFTQADERVAVTIANQAAMAVQNARLYRNATESISRMETVNRRFMAINRVGLKVQEALQVDDIFSLMVDELKELGFDSVILMREGDSLVVRRTSVEPTMLASIEEITGIKMIGYSIPMSNPTLEEVVKAKETAYLDEPLQPVAEVLSRLTGSKLNKILEMLGISRITAAPLQAKDRIIGLLSLWSPELQESDAPAVTAFANQAAIAVQNARLYDEIREKGKKLEKQVEQLERFRKATVQREFRMVELKEKIRELEEKLKASGG